ncbi:conserved hypothetical protein [Cellulomonas flavigena DSM 20109]|uniref:Uncharacterized protein n=1 Tax=Cellulomonas flavigena (strain ATCC 482 / DSM 20109 / BCRC 11376 / JCM 18109 / NBRC 3775 / NCIMB 8073 / NRS 134) TaxID=446466 RepID=D5UE37_CELFN|nr:conserved hypothetical protein [Cellulomonas flavigena DSM 20109]
MTTRVRLMNEYTIDWPLWVDGPAGEGDLPVSERLAGDLKAWARTFNNHYDFQHGWDDSRLIEPYTREGQRLQHALQVELGPGYDVALDLWEVPGAGQSRV